MILGSKPAASRKLPRGARPRGSKKSAFTYWFFQGVSRRCASPKRPLGTGRHRH